ncbi:hypothetical protein ALQ91_102360 [Pseudomonas syringae pv. syringae]|nr:hypothetical protein ALQ91_102360 [Pseudomonas syringae pv. syringae]
MNQCVAKRVTGHPLQTYVDCRARYRRTGRSSQEAVYRASTHKRRVGRIATGNATATPNAFSI